MAPTATTDAPTYQSRMADVATMPPEDLKTLRDQIAAAFEEADSANDTDGMAQAADANEQVAAVAEQRGIDLDKVGAEPEAPAEDQTPDETGAVAAAEADQPQEETAVDAPAVPANRQPLPVAVAASTIVAGADVPGVSAGMPITDKRTFVQAMTDKINALRGARGDGEQVIVASVRAPEVDDSRMLTGDPSDMEKVYEVIGRDANHVKALVASGGYCAPLEPRYDVFGIGVTDRPVRGALPGFRANRGGIRFIAPPKLSGVSGSVGVWTAATDASPGGATKAKLVVTCGPEQTVSISAVTLQMQFGNFIARAYPEMVERNTELGMIAQARLAEQTLLAAMDTLATQTISTISASAGTARDWLNQLGGYAALYRTRHRMADEAPLRVIAPAWVREAVRADVAMSMSPTSDDVLGVADALIQQWLNARNIQVAWHLDDPNFIGNPSTSNPLAATFKWRLFAEGTFLFLDGGTLDVGIVRDSTLVSTNDYIQFTENFEALAMVGVEAWTFTSTSAITGYVGGQLHAGS